MIYFGGLIGYMRNKRLIPYDKDLDILISGEFWKSERLTNVFKFLEKQYGHTHKIVDNGVKRWVCFSKLNNNGIDMWPYYIKNKRSVPHITVPHIRFKTQLVKNMLPLQKVFFENTWTHIPSHPKTVLDVQYGKDKWRNEFTCKKVVEKKCII